MYLPKQGDIVWITLDPRAGSEQMGRRPALIVTNNTFNVVRQIKRCSVTHIILTSFRAACE